MCSYLTDVLTLLVYNSRICSGFGGGLPPGVRVIRCTCCSHIASVVRWLFFLYIFFWMFPSFWEELSLAVGSL